MNSLKSSSYVYNIFCMKRKLREAMEAWTGWEVVEIQLWQDFYTTTQGTGGGSSRQLHISPLLITRYKNHDNARRVEFPLLTSVHHKRNLLQVIFAFVQLQFVVFVFGFPIDIFIFKGKLCLGHWFDHCIDHPNIGKPDRRYGHSQPEKRKQRRHPGDDDL